MRKRLVHNRYLTFTEIQNNNAHRLRIWVSGVRISPGVPHQILHWFITVNLQVMQRLQIGGVDYLYLLKQRLDYLEC